jgi:hypothetical protein
MALKISIETVCAPLDFNVLEKENMIYFFFKLL